MPNVALTSTEKESLAQFYLQDKAALQGIFAVAGIMRDYATVIHIVDNYIDIFPENEHVVFRKLRDAAEICQDKESQLVEALQDTLH